MVTKSTSEAKNSVISALCNNLPSFCMGFTFKMHGFPASHPGQECVSPPQECVGDDISFTVLASKHDTLSGNNALSSWLFMAWLEAEWAVNAHTSSYSTNSCYMCIRERTKPLHVEQPPKKQPLSK